MFGGKDPFDLNGDGKLDYRERAFKLDMEMNNFGYGPDGDGKGGLFGDDFEDEDDEDVESDLELDLELSGFYEWDAAKDKVLFSHKTDELLLLAGFFDRFDKNRRFIIITTEANESVRGVHDRMPLLVSCERLEEWLLTDQFRRMLTETMPPLVAHREYEQLSFEL